MMETSALESAGQRRPRQSSSRSRTRVSRRIVKLIEIVSRGDDPPETELELDSTVAQALTLLNDVPPEHMAADLVRELLARCAPLRIARVGLVRYAALGGTPAWSVVTDALGAVEDVTPLISAFLRVWCGPRNATWYDSLDLPAAFLDRLAGHPDVLDQMESDLVEAEHAHWRDQIVVRGGIHAANMLARSRTTRGVHALIGLIRRLRAREPGWRFLHPLYQAAHLALCEHPDPRAFATLLLDLGTMRRHRRVHGAELRVLASLDPGRARPVIERVLALGALPDATVAALATLGDGDACRHLADLAQHPLERVQHAALVALDSHGGEVSRRAWGAGLSALRRRSMSSGLTVAPEAVLLHPDAEVRREALRALHARRDRSLFVSLVAAEAVDGVLRRAIEDTTISIQWDAWSDLLPRDVLAMPWNQKIAWARGAGAEVVGAQVVLPPLAQVLVKGPAALAARYQVPLLGLDGKELAALRREEDRIFAAL